MSDLNDIYKKGFVSERFKSELEVEFESKLDKEIADKKQRIKNALIDIELSKLGVLPITT